MLKLQKGSITACPFPNSLICFSGLPNSAKGEREYRVTPASTLSIAHQELGGDSDDDFGDFEDAQPDLAAEIRVEPAVFDRSVYATNIRFVFVTFSSLFLCDPAYSNR